MYKERDDTEGRLPAVEIQELEDMQRAVLNILEDTDQEKSGLHDFQRATVNILEDLSQERGRFEETQSAVLNILEDASEEKVHLEETQRATINILEDFNYEKLRMEETQKATLNILEDFNIEKDKANQAYKVLQKEVEARKEAEKFRYNLAALVDSADDAIFSKTLDGMITSWNYGAQELYGYTAEEAIGQHISFLVPPGHKDEIADFLNKIKQDEKVNHFETERFRKDGSLVSVLITLSPIKNDEQRIVGVSAVARDITERKVAERKLREAHAQLEQRVKDRTSQLSEVNEALKEQIEEKKQAEERFRIVIESAPNAMIVFDEHGKVALVNKMTETLFGYDREKLIDGSYKLMIPEQFEGNKELIKAWSKKKKHLDKLRTEKEVYGLTSTGLKIPIEVGLSRVITTEGPYTLVAIVDISERKATEELIRSKNQELETLLYIVSHDLMEPLRGIEYFSSAVSERYREALDNKGQDYLTRIIKAGSRMRLLLQEILMISRARRFTVSSEFVSGKSIVNEAINRLGAMIREKSAHITVAKDFPKLKLEKTWAIQAIYNLINNALKHTDGEQPPEIIVKPYFADKTDPFAQVGVAVCDRGTGVPEEYRTRIFDLFQRAVKREVEGTGSGLAIVKEVAKRHNGEAWMEPHEGGGSKFIITFGNEFKT